MRVYTYNAKNFWKTLQNSKFGLFFRELRSFDLETSITQNNKRQIWPVYVKMRNRFSLFKNDKTSFGIHIFHFRLVCFKVNANISNREILHCEFISTEFLYPTIPGAQLVLHAFEVGWKSNTFKLSISSNDVCQRHGCSGEALFWDCILSKYQPVLILLSIWICKTITRRAWISMIYTICWN